MSGNDQTETPSPLSAAERVKHGVRLLLGTFIIVSVCVNFASVVGRYIFLAPIFWAESIITYLMIWSVFIGAALVTWDDRHLNVDIISSIFPRRWNAVLRLLGALCLLVVIVVILPQSWEVSKMMLVNDQRTAIGELPLAVPHGALLVGFILMAVAAAYQVVRSARIVLGLRPSKPAPTPVAVSETATSAQDSSSES